METITPIFKSNEDRNIVVIMLLLAIFVSFVSPLLVMLFLRDKISETSLEITKGFLNFELWIFLSGVVLMAIPVVGWILGFILSPIILIANLILLVMAMVAVANSQPVKVPYIFKLIK